MIFDPMYFIIVGPGILLALWASIKVKSTFKKYSNVSIASRMSGAEVARELLNRAGVTNVGIEMHQGRLSDHYHPIKRMVRLSPDVYQGRSISSVGVAAHEVGHAIQHAEKYAPMMFRQVLVGPANIGSSLSFVFILLGFFLHTVGLIWVGILLFSLVVLFQLVTFPVEWNASSLAKLKLASTGIISHAEAPHVGKVLNAAAMTYLAALITSILTLVYYVLSASRR